MPHANKQGCDTMPYSCSKRRCKGTKKKAYGEREQRFSLVICMGKAILLSLHINHIYMESIHPTSQQRQTRRKSGKHLCLLFFAFLFLLPSFFSCLQDDESDDNTPVVIPEGFVSVAHRGYHPKGVAENSALAYRHAKFAGFDYGETDIQWTKDDIPVCCHDEFFIDNTTKDSITIRRHTFEELKRFDYHGTSISSLQEVMDTCKRYGLGLYLDRFTAFSKERQKRIFAMIDDFGKEKVCYIFGNREKEGIKQVLEYDSCATIALLHFQRIDQELIDFANSISTSTNKIILDVDHTTNPITVLQQFGQVLKPNVHYSVFTINNKKTYKKYLPYAISITSDQWSARNLR